MTTQQELLELRSLWFKGQLMLERKKYQLEQLKALESKFKGLTSDSKGRS